MMKKNATITTILMLVGMMLSAPGVWGQGFEDFENSNLTATYANGSFTGNNDIEWTYVHSRNEGDFPIDAKGIMLRRADEPSSLSATIPGGIGNFSVDTRKAFTGNIQRRLELVINGNVIAQFEPEYADGADDTVIPFVVDDINIAGDFQLTLRLYGPNGSNQQMVLDNLEWTGYVTDDPVLTVLPVTLTGLNYVENQGPSNSESFTLSGTNLDDSDVTITAPTNFEVSESESSGFGPTITLPAYDGSSKLLWVRLKSGLDVGVYSETVTISGGGADEVTVAVAGEVFEQFGIPYANAFRQQADNERALIQGFKIDNAQNETGAGGYLRIFPEGFLETPTIDFTNYDFLKLQFNATTFGGTLGQELTVFVSSDNGENFEIADVYSITDSYVTYTSFIDLTDSFNSDEGVIKIEMTDGGGSTRLRDYSIDEAYGREIAGNSGWRMLAMPVEGVTIADIASQNQVQGFSGLSAFYGGQAPSDIETAAQNLYLGFDGSQWASAGSVEDELEPGHGFIWYMYDNDEGVGVPLPFVLAINGNEPEDNVPIGIHSDGNGFNLLGNPFLSDIDVSEIDTWISDGSLSSSIIQVWENDPAGWQEGIGHQGVWRQLGPGAEDGSLLAAWQGFMLENENATEIEIPTSAKTDGATFYKEQKETPKRIAFTLLGERPESEIRTRDGANLVFSDRAEDGWDLLDASQLTPLAGSFATLSFVGERNGNEVLKVQESRPAVFEGSFEIPMAFNAWNMAGDFTISWDGIADLPSEWQFTLVDKVTGISTNLREASEYAFSYQPDSETLSKQAIGTDVNMPEIRPLTLASDEDNGVRFTLVVNSEPVSTELPGDVPQELELAQNYPNPFNPSTVIRYSVPEQAHIRLTVYDMLGRELIVLVNEQKGPGTYDVNWDATDFSSGMYLYRLEAGTNSMTRRMTLIK